MNSNDEYHFSEKFMIKFLKISLYLCGMGTALLMLPFVADAKTPLQKERIKILQAHKKGPLALSTLWLATQNNSVLIRRAAVRSLGQIGKPAHSMLLSILNTNEDALTRRTALRMLAKIVDHNDTIAISSAALSDDSSLVRSTAVQILANTSPYTEKITTLLKKARKDDAEKVSRVASKALWPYHKKGISFQQLPANKDHQLTIAQKITLPKDDWKFHLDPDQLGHERDWFEPNFDDDEWDEIKIQQVWGKQIGRDYQGAAWYRHTFTLPKKPEQLGTDVVFDGVDESAWVWINGVFVGQHDIGLKGWNKRFAIDVTDHLKWNAKNHITVRVLNTKLAGGIWKPVYFEVLK